MEGKPQPCHRETQCHVCKAPALSPAPQLAQPEGWGLPAPASPGRHHSFSQVQEEPSPGCFQPCGAISTGNWFWCSLVFILSGAGDALNDVKETVKWVSFRFLGSFWR